MFASWKFSGHVEIRPGGLVVHFAGVRSPSRPRPPGPGRGPLGERAHARLTRPVHAAGSATVSSRWRRDLVVEDQPAIAESVVRAADGFTVETAGTRAAATSAGDADLIALDLMLPDGQVGFDLIGAWRRAGRLTPIIGASRAATAKPIAWPPSRPAPTTT